MQTLAPATDAAAGLVAVPAGPHPFVPRLPVPPATSLEACDAAVADVRAAADRWTRTSAAEVAGLLDEVLRATAAVADRWTDLGSRHEGLDPDGPDGAEEAMVGPYIFLRGVRLHRDALRDIARHGRPAIPGPVRTLPDGRVTAQVFPGDLVDRVTYIGTTAEVWMERGVTPRAAPGHDGARVAHAAWTAGCASSSAQATRAPSGRSTRSTSSSWSARSSSSSCTR